MPGPLAEVHLSRLLAVASTTALPQRGPSWIRTSLSDIVSISSGLALEFES